MNPNDARNEQGQYDDGKPDGAKKSKGRRPGPPLPNALEQCITLDMVQNVVNTIYVMALRGDMPAARLFLQYAVGKPAKMQDANHGEAQEPETDEQTDPTAASPVAATVEQTDPRAATVEPTERKPPAPGKQTVPSMEKSVASREQTVRTASPSPQAAPRVEARRANGTDGEGTGSSGARGAFTPHRGG